MTVADEPILVATGVVKTFGGLRAVDVDQLENRRNKITALIGPNGAGKTTFFNLLTGFDQVDEGEIQFDGKVITGTPPHRLAAEGMVRTFQLTKALAKLSTIENMKLGALNQRGEKFWAALIPGYWTKQEQDIEQRADAILQRFNLTHMRDEYAGTMSGGQRKLLEMARALMTDPRLVMLDEPMAGVNPALAQSLLELIKALPGEGRTVIFVEHNMDVVQEIADWVVVMAEGRIIAQGTPAEIKTNKAVVDAYLGAHHGEDLSQVELT